MNSCQALLLTVLWIASIPHCWGDQAVGDAHIQWHTNYEEAVNLSAKHSKPLLLFFTGSDWCGWCNKLEEEVLDTTLFNELAGDKFIFVKLDFPMYAANNPQLTAQNKQLQKRYNVKSYPSIILLNTKQQQIGITGYRSGGPRQYASHLLKMLSDFHSYLQNMDKLDSSSLSGNDIKQLAEKATELGLVPDLHKIIKAGIASDQKAFFQIEKYRLLADEGLIHDPEAAALKQQLLASDPQNERRTHYQLAVIEFEAFCTEMDKENYDPAIAIAPLNSYIQKFGQQDKENAWRLQMIISQVFLEKNKPMQALQFAQSSYDSAPLTVRSDIAIAIQNIKLESGTR